MVRLQARLTQEQIAVLRQLSAERQTSVSELVREAVDLLIARSSRNVTADQLQRALAFVGSFSDTATDVSENHDHYLAEIWAAKISA